MLPETTPTELTVATKGRLLAQTPPVDATDNVVVVPVQSELLPVIAPAAGNVSTVITIGPDRDRIVPPGALSNSHIITSLVDNDVVEKWLLSTPT